MYVPLARARPPARRRRAPPRPTTCRNEAAARRPASTVSDGQCTCWQQCQSAHAPRRVVGPPQHRSDACHTRSDWAPQQPAEGFEWPPDASAPGPRHPELPWFGQPRRLQSARGARYRPSLAGVAVYGGVLVLVPWQHHSSLQCAAHARGLWQLEQLGRPPTWRGGAKAGAAQTDTDWSSDLVGHLECVPVPCNHCACCGCCLIAWRLVLPC